MIAMIARLCDCDFEDINMIFIKYYYVESKGSKRKCGNGSSDDRARRHPPWPRILPVDNSDSPSYMGSLMFV